MEARRVLHEYLYNAAGRETLYAGTAFESAHEPDAWGIVSSIHGDGDGRAVMKIETPGDEVTFLLNGIRELLTDAVGLGQADSHSAADADRPYDRDWLDATAQVIACNCLAALGQLELRAFSPIEPQIVQTRPLIAGMDHVLEVRMLLRTRPALDDYGPVRIDLSASPDTDVAAELDAWAQDAFEQCADALAERLVDGPPPIHVELRARELACQQTNAPDLDPREINRLRSQLAAIAERDLRREMALDAYAEHLGLVVAERDVLEVAGEGQAEDPEPVLMMLMQEGQLPALCDHARRFKVGGLLVRKRDGAVLGGGAQSASR